jgi:hypothetical protein
MRSQVLEGKQLGYGYIVGLHTRKSNACKEIRVQERLKDWIG